MTCLVAACFAALFHIVPFIVFSACHLANSLITSEMHSEVRPAWMLSHWRIFTSLSVPSFHLGYVDGALNCIQPSLLFDSSYQLSVSMSYRSQHGHSSSTSVTQVFGL